MDEMIFLPQWIAIADAFAVRPDDDDDYDDDDYDESADGLVRCPDCGHTDHPGWYIGARVRELCKTCDGSGWV